MDEGEARRRVAAARVARLATLNADGTPHLVPICFVLDGDTVWSVVDGKPKTTQALRRLDNVRRDPHASLLVDHYGEDWTTLWWVRLDGSARVVDDHHALPLLQQKYEQYRRDPPAGPALALTVERWRWWETAAREP